MVPFGNLMGDLEGVLAGKPGAASTLFSNALSDAGGYEGILADLEKAGLGDRVQSWLGSHSGNLPITPDEIKAALGDQRLQQLAQKFGVPLDQVAELLSRHLPQAVDEASPNGKLEPPKPDAAPQQKP
ncbi:MAG TPA: YidB family protein [Pararhizobium sp.]|nr:YidB family protein [Pararhizobium sp.]